jgi:hypothetical protein
MSRQITRLFFKYTPNFEVSLVSEIADPGEDQDRDDGGGFA